MGKFLKTTRVVLAILLYAGINCLLAGLLEAVPALDWLGRIQIFPALMAHATLVVVIWGVVTLFFGRIYCSTVCPLGVFMDITSRAARLTPRQRAANPYRFTVPLTALRYAMLAVPCIASVISILTIPVFLDPYTDYAYFIYCIAKFVATSATAKAAAVSTIGATLGTLIVIGVGVVAAMRGRLVCNTVCPVGTALGILARESYLRIDINTDLCSNCFECERVCKGSCIDLTQHVVDMSRCVVCFDCLTVCRDKAIRYTRNRHRLSFPLMQSVKPTASAACDSPTRVCATKNSKSLFNNKC